MKHNAMIVGLATILLTLVGGTFGRVAAEPMKGNCGGISEAFLVTGLPSGYCEVASTNNQAAAEPTTDHCGGISEAFLVTGLPSGYCEVASTNNTTQESLMALKVGISDAFLVTGFPPGYYR